MSVSLFFFSTAYSHGTINITHITQTAFSHFLLFLYSSSSLSKIFLIILPWNILLHTDILYRKRRERRSEDHVRLVSILAKDHFIVQFSLQFFFVFLSSFFLSYPSSDSPDIHKKVKQRKPSLSLNHYQISLVFFHHKCLGTTTTCTCSDYYVIISLSFSTTPTSSPHKEHKRKFRGSLSFSKSPTILHINLPFHSSLSTF